LKVVPFDRLCMVSY